MSQPSATAPKKVLLVVSSATPEFWLGKFHTGFFFTEVLHPYLTYKNHGYDVDIVSENGKGGIDVNSIPYAQIDGESRRAYNNSDHEIWTKLNNLKSASEVNADDYSIVFYAGGHGASYDFPTAKQLQSIGSKIYGSGGIIGSVCHGPAIFMNLKDPQNESELLIKGKKVTAFSERGEMMMTATPVMKAQGIPSMREYMEQAGANWQEPTKEHMNPMAAYVVEDGRIVTGTTPMAAADIAQRTVELAHPGEKVEDKRPAKSIL